MKFVIRVGISPEFAAKVWEAGGNPVHTLIRNLGAFVTEETNIDCVTFLSMRAEAETEEAAENCIRNVWEKTYPGYAGAISIMMVEDDGSDVAQLMANIYSVYFGFDEYQRLCTQLARTMPRVLDSPAMEAFRSMNYLVSIDDGCGFTTMAASLADFLGNLGLFETMQTSFLEYVVDKDEENGGYPVKKLMEFLGNEQNHYKLVAFDVSYFLNSEKKEELRSFLKQLDKLQKYYVFLFRIPYLEERARTEFQELLEDIVELKTVVIPPYPEMILEEYAFNRNAQYAYDVEVDVMDVVLKRVHKEKMDGRFYGFRSMNKIINEMVWAKLDADVKAEYNGRAFDAETLSKRDFAEMLSEETKKTTGFEDLAGMIGMEGIAKRLEEIVAQVLLAIQNERMERPCLHMRFVGPPGTGKTTVARIVGKIFREKGILKKGGFFEYAARSLCGEFVGQTAPKTHAICRDAYGSVLFIDEAYALYAGDNDRDYGKEALTTLIAEMENHRDDLVIIMAGYTDDMEKLMEGNIGLKSRMPFILEFQSYTREQLTQIFMSMARKGFSCEEGFEQAVSAYFQRMDDSYLKSKEFANARFVRNLYERTWAKAALRTAGTGNTEIILTKTDFEAASSEKEFSEKLMMEKKIGF